MTYIQFREFCQPDNGCGVYSFDPLHSQSKRSFRVEKIISTYQVVQETGEGPSVQQRAKYISWGEKECDSTGLVWTTRSRKGFLNSQPRRWTPRSAIWLNTAPNLFWRVTTDLEGILPCKNSHQWHIYDGNSWPSDPCFKIRTLEPILLGGAGVHQK